MDHFSKPAVLSDHGLHAIARAKGEHQGPHLRPAPVAVGQAQPGARADDLFPHVSQADQFPGWRDPGDRSHVAHLPAVPVQS